MLDIEKTLNDEQRQVVKEGDGYCLVLAGAGSGKTRTIAYRVAYLLEQGVSPTHILLLTFTNKAAKEMNERIEAMLAGDTKILWSGTFHHVCFRMLKQCRDHLDYGANFTVIDSEDSYDLLKLCLKSEGLDKDKKRFPSAKVIYSMISFSKNAMMPLPDVIESQHPHWGHHQEAILRIASLYAQKKKEAHVMDFDDLLYETYLLLQKAPAVREYYAKQFQYVLVDEYQDTNKIQAGIIKLLSSAHQNLLVVGDDAQSIYSFRAAEIENILSFDKLFPGVKRITLHKNYRSTPDILDVANDVIQHNTHQFEKKLTSDKDGFTKPEIHALENSQEEARFIVQRMLELRDEGVPLSEMAVLFRASYHSQALEMELTKRDIPYDYRGGVRFFERTHIKDVLALLKIFTNQNDIISWSRMLGKQVGIGPATAQKIIDSVRAHGIPKEEKEREVFVQEVTEKLPLRAKQGWRDFMEMYEDLALVSEVTSSSLVRAVLQSSYTEYLEAEYPNYRERLQDVEQLAIFAEKTPDVPTFLGEASLQESYVTKRDTGAADDEPGVVLSTVHQAKGLEWEAVFVLNVAHSQFPNDKAVQEGSLEEERRLFYVAVTRAKTYLYMTYPLLAGFQGNMQGPSMFLNEIDTDHITEQHAFQGSTVWSDPSDDIDDIVYVSEDEIDQKRGSFFSDFSEW